MQIIPADPTRMIDLPGVGPCPRPVDIHPGVTGFTRLKSLRIYRFDPGPPIHGDSEEDEVFITALQGLAAMQITGPHPLSATLSAADPGAVYMTPLHSYVLTPETPAVIAYARAEASGRVPCQTVRAPVSHGRAEHLRWHLSDLRDGAPMAVGGAGLETLVHVAAGALRLRAEVLTQGQTLALSNGETAILTAEGAARLLILSA